MSNRVEELESTVRELQAAVDGLTEELVETRERLRQLEEAGTAPSEDEPSGRAESSDAHAERVDADGGVEPTAEPSPESGAETGAAEPPTDAAEPSDGEPAEADAAADAGSESDSGSDDDEIIVA